MRGCERVPAAPAGTTRLGTTTVIYKHEMNSYLNKKENEVIGCTCDQVHVCFVSIFDLIQLTQADVNVSQ
jgi:hypothetical protein